MKYIKIFEDFNDDKLKSLSDLFIDFEDEDWSAVLKYDKIVTDRDDWTGNFKSTKVRNIFGKDFIDYHKDVIMSNGERRWEAKSAFNVHLSKISYIKNMTEEAILKHWEELDEEIRKRVNKISRRAELLDIKLYGVVGKWFQLGKASSSDFKGKPFYGYDIIVDHITFAFFE